jgi:hypothetical protein
VVSQGKILLAKGILQFVAQEVVGVALGLAWVVEAAQEKVSVAWVVEE